MLDYILKQTDKYLSSKTKAERKKIGQFFTSKETAIYMAELFDINPSTEINVLDPGAGSGVLSAAFVERLQSFVDIKTIKLTCYENNSEIIDLLSANLQYIKLNSQISVEYTIVTDNYILSQNKKFNNVIDCYGCTEKYDYIIGNPPYLKISKDAPEATTMPLVCYGAPNLYFLFAAMSLFNLRNNGEMVYIIPRSWTSGAYFKRFREYFLSEGKLLNIHLFISRDKVFDKENVLQETIIIKVKKQKEAIPSIKITSSKSNNDFENITKIITPYNVVVSGDDDHYVFLVTNDDQLNILEKLERWKDTLPSIGLKMKTGLTVDFRNRDLLREEKDDNNVPLFYSQHIQDGHVIFPANREHEYISNEQKGMIQKNKNYLFVKRFTAKEEKRRLQSGIYLSKLLPEYQFISTQNKINFIDRIDGLEMSENVVYGLYVVFNSTIYDAYYRILNGSTQVNSTEINAMPVPTLQLIEKIGDKLKQTNDFSVRNCDAILEEII